MSVLGFSALVASVCLHHEKPAPLSAPVVPLELCCSGLALLSHAGGRAVEPVVGSHTVVPEKPCCPVTRPRGQSAGRDDPPARRGSPLLGTADLSPGQLDRPSAAGWRGCSRAWLVAAAGRRGRLGGVSAAAGSDPAGGVRGVGGGCPAAGDHVPGGSAVIIPAVGVRAPCHVPFLLSACGLRHPVQRGRDGGVDRGQCLPRRVRERADGSLCVNDGVRGRHRIGHDILRHRQAAAERHGSLAEGEADGAHL
mmetsp:Transcript_16861/g.42276  ORF Transcript_16861/g.42276 Transcript_16861/m.42276 type:complete len:252 (-) Transcript_16861:541-1296(-)